MIFAEVSFDDFRVVLNRRRRAFGDLQAVVEDGDALAHAHDHAHRMFHQQEREFELAVNTLDKLNEFNFLRGVHARGRFIQEEQARLGRERAHDFEAALFAVRQAFRRRVAESAKIENLKQLFRLPGDRRFFGMKTLEPDQRLPRARGAVEIRGGADIVEHAETAKETDVLKGAGNPARGNLAGAQTGQIATGETHCAFGRLIDARDQVEDRRFAGTVRSDQSAEFSFVDDEIERVDRAESTEADRRAFELKQRFPRRFWRRRGG